MNHEEVVILGRVSMHGVQSWGGSSWTHEMVHQEWRSWCRSLQQRYEDDSPLLLTFTMLAFPTAYPHELKGLDLNIRLCLIEIASNDHL